MSGCSVFLHRVYPPLTWAACHLIDKNNVLSYGDMKVYGQSNDSISIHLDLFAGLLSRASTLAHARTLPCCGTTL